MSEVNQRKWPCMCIDLETLATSADAVVLEIGAVMFDPEAMELGPEYHAEVEMRAPDNRLRGIDANTLVWWAERVKDGHDMPGMYGGISLWQALGGLAAWLAAVPRQEDMEVWAWGSDFDFSILRHAHDEAQLALPWRYSRQCDARSFCGKLGIQREGPVTHQALADAKQEAQAVMGAMFKLAAMEGGMSHESRGTGEEQSVSFSSPMTHQPMTPLPLP
jgi:hypothetical protein